jgi:hypothetical protein
MLSFVDMLFNALIVFAALFILTVVIINEPAKKTKTVDERAKILVTLTWNDDSADDMDLWLLTPEPKKIGYNQSNGNLASLARDDVGKRNDFYEDRDHVQHYIHLNKEVITIREKMPGHYEVNVMFYSRNEDPENGNRYSHGPQEVTVQVIQIDPSYVEVATQSVMLNEEREQKTAVSFDIVNGNVVNVDTITQDPFVTRKYGPSLPAIPTGD